jgi:phage terminase small subunit
LSKVDIRRELERRLAHYDVTAERVLAELARIAFANIQDYVVTNEDGKPRLRNLQDLSRDAAAGLVKWSATRHSVWIRLDKVAALERLGKHLKLFTEKVDLGGDTDLAELLKAGRARAAQASVRGDGK